MEYAFSTNKLTVHYDQVPALWEVSFSIPKGKMVGIIGPNGAGKSTLLKAALGFERTASGEVQVFGKPYSRMRKRVAYVPQRSSVDWDFPITARDVVAMGLYPILGPFKWVGKKDLARADEALERLGLESIAHRQIRALSGGQQQRVFLARALLQQADLYIMDEPFAGVDMATEKALISLFSELAEQGKTLLVVHHDLTTVCRYFDWVVMLNRCLIAVGPIKEAYNKKTLEKTYGSCSAALFDAGRLFDLEGE